MRGTTGWVAAAVVLGVAVVTLGGCSAVAGQPGRTSEAAAASGLRAGEASASTSDPESGVSSVRSEKRPPDTHVKAALVWSETLAGPMTYDEAVQYCVSLDHDDRWNWRLPTYWELKAIAEEEGIPSKKSRTGKLYIKEPFRKRFEDIREPSVWAYGPEGKHGQPASLCYDFACGTPGGSMKSIPHYVLAVRDKPY